MSQAIDDTRFSAEEVVLTRLALHRARQLGLESVDRITFLHSLTDEICALREMGFVDEEIAAIIERAVRRPISGEDLTMHCPRPDGSGTNAGG
jgi:hypothetical protein